MANDKTEIMGNPPAATALQDLEQQCPNCDAEMLAGEQFCPKCGYQRGSWQGSAQDAASADDRRAAFELRSSSGSTWPVYAGENEIGRGEVQIQLDNPYASRLHAVIAVNTDGTATIADLGSSNGTLIGGAAIEPNSPQPLAPGVEFTIGEDRFTLHAIAAEAEAEESAPEESAAAEDASEPAAAETGDEPAAAAPEVEEEDDAADVVLSPWTLTIGEGEPRQLPLGETLIGRRAVNGGMVVEGDGYVSGTHCKVSAGMDSLNVEDLGSTNGTRIGEDQLVPGEPVELKPGAVFTVGQTSVTVGHSDMAAPDENSDDAGEAAIDSEAEAEPAPED